MASSSRSKQRAVFPTANSLLRCPILRGVRNGSARPETLSITPRSLANPIWVFFAVLALFLGSSSAHAEKFPFASGDEVLVEGVVTDSNGRPLPNLEIVLEVAKMRISLRPPGKAKANIVRGATATDTEGHFGLRWEWRPGFDRFEVIVAVTVPEPTGKHLQVLFRLDITDQVQIGSPIVVPVILEDTALIDELKTFQDNLNSADEHRVYQGSGRPDRIDREEFVHHTESAWWYFRFGKVYRFEDGVLVKVDDFEPVDSI